MNWPKWASTTWSAAAFTSLQWFAMPFCGFLSTVVWLSCSHEDWETLHFCFFNQGKEKTLLSPLSSTIASAVLQNTYTHGCSQTGLTEFSNCPPERPSPLGFGPAGRSVLVPELPAHTHTHTLTAMPQRYSHQRRKASTAAARRMERRRREQGKSNNNNNPTSSHNHRSKKLAMLSRYQHHSKAYH